MLSRHPRAGPASMVPPPMSAHRHWPITATSLVFRLSDGPHAPQKPGMVTTTPYPAQLALLVTAAQTRRNGN